MELSQKNLLYAVIFSLYLMLDILNMKSETGEDKNCYYIIRQETEGKWPLDSFRTSR